MVGRTQVIARVKRAHGVSGGKAQYHEPGAGFLKKLILLMIAMSLATSMVPASALANVVGAEEATDAAGVVQTTDGADADSGTDAKQTDGVEDDAAQTPCDPAVGSEDDNADAPNDTIEKPIAGDEVSKGDEGFSASSSVSGTGGDADTQVATIEVTCSIIGVDAAGNPQAWAPSKAFDVKQGATAADATVAAFKAAGIEAKYDPEGAYGFYLESITSPFDESLTLGWDESTGRYWQLFVNGEVSSVGASSVDLSAGDVVTWAYSSYGQGIPEVSESIEVTCSIIGVDAAGNPQAWAPSKAFDVKQGATAADATVAAFKAAGIEAKYDPEGAYGFYLESITSPFDESLTLGWDESTGRYWQLFVNGEVSSVGASEVSLRAGDTVMWYYAADGASLPSEGGMTDPNAERPELDADWPGFAGGSAGATVTTPTPTEAADLAWKYDFKDGAFWATVSDLLVVGGDIYLVASGKIQRIDGDTGKPVVSMPTGEDTQYICRPVYADGLIVVAYDGGKLAAYTADTLTCVWKTASFAPEGSDRKYQAMSSLTVSNGFVYAMFSPQNGDNPTTEGVMVCVSLKDGSAKWIKRTGTAAQEDTGGFYWAGAAASGDDLIVGDDFGKVALIDGETGVELSSVAVSGPCRAGIVAADTSETGEGSYLAVTKGDGILHKIERTGDTLKLAGSVKFSATSTSTPAVVQGKAVVCGSDSLKYPVNGTISVIDIATMTLEKSVVAGAGQSQSAPLISVQGDGVYAYFTCNSMPGGVYRYKLGDDAAEQLYVPESDVQNFCLASIVADAAGNLYYTNDSGTLFKLSAAPSFAVSFESNGGSAVSTFRVAQGKPMTQPGDPTREGRQFLGWFVDEELTQAWDFSQPVSGDMTLYAKWSEETGDGGSGIKPPIDPGESNPAPQGGPSSSSPATSQSASSSSYSTKVVPTYGVVATRTPLSEVTQTTAALVAADDEKASSAAQESANGSSSSAKKEPSASDSASAAAADTASASATLNPLAVAGIAVGVVALAGVMVYFVVARRRA